MLPPSDSLLASHTVAEINLSAFHENVKAFQRIVGNSLLLTVIKTNAYGHGIVPIAKEAVKAGADRLGVTTIEEGVLLRQCGLHTPIQLLSSITPNQAEYVVEYDLIASISSESVAYALNDAALSQKKRATVHLKINTGLNRFGIEPDEALPFCEACFNLHGLHWEGIYTHFSHADEGDWEQTERQFRTYMDTVSLLEERGYHFPIHHVGASTIAIERKDMHLDMVRPGIALFGYQPAIRQLNKLQLKKVLTLKTNVMQIHDLPPNTSVGYGGSYMTDGCEKIGVLPIGHGDGFKRHLSNNGHVLINEARAKIVGTISLDQTFVNLSEAPNVKIGDEVVLIGSQGKEMITARDIANWIDSNVDEVLASLMNRIRRVYTRGSNDEAI